MSQTNKYFMVSTVMLVFLFFFLFYVFIVQVICPILFILQKLGLIFYFFDFFDLSFLYIFNNKNMKYFKSKLNFWFVPSNIIIFIGIIGVIMLFYYDFPALIRMIFILILFILNYIICFFFPSLKTSGIIFHIKNLEYYMQQTHTVKRLNPVYIKIFYIITTFLVCTYCISFFFEIQEKFFGYMLPIQFFNFLLCGIIHGHELYRVIKFKSNTFRYLYESKWLMGLKLFFPFVASCGTAYVSAEGLWLTFTGEPGPLANKAICWRTGVQTPDFRFTSREEVLAAIYIRNNYAGVTLDNFLTNGRLSPKTLELLQTVQKNSNLFSTEHNYEIMRKISEFSKNEVDVFRSTPDQIHERIFYTLDPGQKKKLMLEPYVQQYVEPIRLPGMENPRLPDIER